MSFQRNVTAVNRQFSSQTLHAFTLIELLVVVAIIALLVAIITPAILQARQLAQQTVCSEHLSQFGLAFHFFAEDNNGVLPGKAGPIAGGWSMALNGTRVVAPYGCVANEGPNYLPVDVNDPSLFHPNLSCPANDYPQRGGRFSYGMAYSRTVWDCGVPCGGTLGSTTQPHHPLKLAEIQQPSSAPLLIELWQRAWDAYVIPYAPTGLPQADNGYHDWGIFWDVHGDSMNVLFADRSVRRASQGIWLDDQGNFPRPTYGPSGNAVLPLAHWFSATELDLFGKPSW